MCSFLMIRCYFYNEFLFYLVSQILSIVFLNTRDEIVLCSLVKVIETLWVLLSQECFTLLYTRYDWKYIYENGVTFVMYFCKKVEVSYSDTKLKIKLQNT